MVGETPARRTDGHVRHATIILAAVSVAIACSSERAARDTSSRVAPPAGDTSDVSGWRVTPNGLGPVRVGMTSAEVRSALGDAWQERTGAAPGPGAAAECRHVNIGGLSATVRAMLVSDRIVRVEVDTGDVATDRGARIGDSEARIDSLYRGQVRVGPHEYTDGRYLVVIPPADTLRRIVFETDGRIVTRYRAGKIPEAEWVEGCS